MHSGKALVNSDDVTRSLAVLQASMTERGKYQEETLSNVGGRSRNTSGGGRWDGRGGSRGPGDELIVVRPALPSRPAAPLGARGVASGVKASGLSAAACPPLRSTEERGGGGR